MVKSWLLRHCFDRIDLDGCAFGLIGQNDHKGKPIKKPWTLASNCQSTLALFDRKCPGPKEHPDHGKCEGNETKLTEDYTWPMANIAHMAFTTHVQLRTHNPNNTPYTDATTTTCNDDIPIVQQDGDYGGGLEWDNSSAHVSHWDDDGDYYYEKNDVIGENDTYSLGTGSRLDAMALCCRSCSCCASPADEEKIGQGRRIYPG
jgi:hypothetical protein